jgi:hypothetical protein
MPPEVKYQPLTQPTYASQVGPDPLQVDRKGSLELKKGDFKIDSVAGKKYTKIADAKVNRERDPESLKEIKISELHDKLKAIDFAQTEPGFKRNWKSFTSWVKDSKVGRFFTKSVIPKFTTTKVDDLTISAQVLGGGRTKLTIQVEGTEETFEAQGGDEPKLKSSKSIKDDNKIVTEYDKLRGRHWHEKIRFVKRLSPEKIVERLNTDITRQARLRNCGIGYTAENRFNTANSGLVKTLNNPKALKLSDFTVDELQNLQDFYKEFSANLPAQFPPLDNAKIENFKNLLLRKNEQSEVINSHDAYEGAKKSASKQLAAIEKQIKKADISFLKPLVVAAQIRQIKALVNAFGPASLTQDQNVALDRFALALGFNPGRDGSKRFDAETFQSALLDFDQAQAIQELALMTSEALRSGHPKAIPTDNDLQSHSADNLKKLLEWEPHGVAPLGLLVSAPWFFSPEACDKQIENLNKLSEESAPASLKSYLQEFKAEQKDSSLQISEEVNQDFDDQVKDATSGLNQLKDNRAGLYRWQGLMPLFAANNEVKINQAFNDQLEDAFAQTTGYNKGTSRRMLAGGLAVAGGLGAAVNLAKGNNGQAAWLAVGASLAALAAQKTKNEDKYEKRLTLLSAAIVDGLVRGTVQQLDKASQALAQAKIEEIAENFIKDQTKQLSDSQTNIESLQDFSSLDKDLEKLISNERVKKGKEIPELDKSAHLKGIRGDIEEKINSAKSEVEKAKTQGVRLGFDSGKRERVDEESLNAKSLSPLDGPEEIHDKLTINPQDVTLDPDIAKKLREFNDITLKNAQGLEKSLGIVQDAYIEGGKIHSKISGIEKDLTALFAGVGDSKKLCEVPTEQIQMLVTNINELRTNISSKAASLTNDHATHLHTLINALDAKAGRLVEAKLAMNRIATAFAKGSDAYLDGTEPDSNSLESDLKFLEGLKTNSDNKKDLLLFGEEKIDKAFQEGGPVATFLIDAKSAAEGWKNYKTHQKAITNRAAVGGEFDNSELIDGLRVELKKCKLDADTASKQLDAFSTKYIGVGQANYTTRTTEIYQEALLAGGARLIGNVPVNDQTRHGLSILVSQFGTNKGIQNKISAYILQGQSPDGLAIPGEKIQERFVELFEGLPTFDINQIDDPIASVKWKSDLTPGKALAFIAKIEPGYCEDSRSLQGAIDIAKAFEGGLQDSGGIGKVSASIHREHIKNQFEKVIKSNAIKAIYQPLESMAKPDIRRVLQNHSGSLDTLARYGYNKNEFISMQSNLNLLDTYDKFQNDESLNEAEYNLLSVVGEGLAKLEDKPEVTKQLRLRAEVFALLAKANSELGKSTDFNAIDESQIGNFEFKPINQAEKFAKLNSQIDVLEKKLTEARQASHGAENRMNEALGQFVENFGGDSSVRANFEKDPQMRKIASELIVISDAYNQGTGKTRESLDREIELNRLTDKYDASQLQKKYNDANARATVKRLDKQINRETLRYVDTKSLSLNYDLKNQDDAIKAEKSASLWSIFGQMAPAIGAGGIQRLVPHGISAETKALDADTRIYKEKLPQTINRLINDQDSGNRIEALREALQSFEIAQKQKVLADNCQKLSIDQTNGRDKLLKASDRIAYQQAVKAATVKSLLYDKAFEPQTLQSSDHKQLVLDQLKLWGWDDKQLPIQNEIESAIGQIAKAKGIPQSWQDEMANSRTALKQQIQQIEALSKQIQEAILLILKDFSGHADVAQNLSDATGFSKANHFALLELQNLDACLNSPTNLQPLSVAREAISQIVEKATKSFPGHKAEIVKWGDSLKQNLEQENLAKWPEVSKIVAEHITPSDGSKSLSDICFGSDEKNRVVEAQNLLSSIYKRAFESESQKILDSKANELVDEEQKITKEFNRQISALRNPKIGELFKTDESGNSLLYEKRTARTWISKYAEEQKITVPEAAAKVSDMTLPQFQDALKNKNGLGGVLYGESGDRLRQAQAFFANLQASRIKIATALEGFQKGQMTWKEFSTEVNSMSGSASSVKKKATFGADAMNSLAGAIEVAQGALKDNLISELNSLNKLISGSSYSPDKLGDLATAYSRAEGELTAYPEDVPSPYDPAPDRPLINGSRESNVEKPEENPASNEAAMEMIIEEDEPEVRLQNPSIPSPPIDPRIQQQLEAINLAAQQPPPQAQPLSGTLSNELLSSFQGNDGSEIQKRANKNWSELTRIPKAFENNLPYLQNYQHVAVEGKGFCSLTAMATFHGMKTSELVARLQAVAQETNQEAVLKEILQKMNTDSSGFELTNGSYQKLFADAGLSFWVLTLNSNKDGFVASPVGKKPADANAPALLFTKQLSSEEGHFDLLAPPNHLAGKVNLPTDAQKYVTNDYRMR